MKNKFNYFFVAIILINLCGCDSLMPSPIPRGDYFRAPTQRLNDNYATLYIYNSEDKNTYYEPTIYLDDVKLTTLPGKSYTIVKVPPGTYLIYGNYPASVQFFNKAAKPEPLAPIFVTANKYYYLQTKNDRYKAYIESSQSTDSFLKYYFNIGPTYPTVHLFSNIKSAADIDECQFVQPLTKTIIK